MPEPVPAPESVPGVNGQAFVADCARVLTDAFAREPSTSWICGASTAVRGRWFDATLRAQATLPGVRRYTLAGVDGRCTAAAVLTPPGLAPGAGTQARWAARTLLGCGPRPLRRTLRYLHVTEAGVPAGSWTLEFIGVVPEAAGRGAGRLLLDRLLGDVPPASGVFLTTADPENVFVYRHFGFTTLRQLSVGPLDVTAMWRRGAGGP
ncbi:hypothetical protein ACFWSF_32585 [Streptomyces sp. NPDC058611]|uniref:hypothetical protein n=1 Tax=unclassified Streptomyces TaxID=2593676 RepID=UPI00364DEE79